MKRAWASSSVGAIRPVTDSTCVWKTLSRSTSPATSSVISASWALRCFSVSSPSAIAIPSRILMFTS